MPLQAGLEAHAAFCRRSTDISRVYSGLGMVLTIHPLLVSSLWMGGSYTSAFLSTCIGMSWGDPDHVV